MLPIWADGMDFASDGTTPDSLRLRLDPDQGQVTVGACVIRWWKGHEAH